MRTLLTPKWLLSHLFVVLMTVLMVSLAFWQLSRLDDTRADNDSIRAAAEAAPSMIEDLLSADQLPLDHTAAVVKGSYLPEASFLVANRTFDSRAGSWLATPVRLDDGEVVVVSRGWVPRLWVAGTDPRDATPPQGRVEITGRVFDTLGGGRIGSGTADYAEVSRIDLAVVSDAIGLDVADLWVQLESQVPASGDLPVPVPPPTLNDGPHLSYAFQWFFFSAAAVVVYVMILRRRVGQHRNESTT